MRTPNQERLVDGRFQMQRGAGRNGYAIVFALAL